MDMINLLESKLPALSKGQKRIAQYILDHFDNAAFMTAAAVGKAVQVSESTVVRFAACLGFDGYPELQKALQEAVLNRLTNPQRMEAAKKRMADGNILSQTLQADAERIRQSEEMIDQAVFDGAVESLMKAKRIYILGVRSSSALAYFLNYYLSYIFDDVRLITSASASVILEQLVRIEADDVLLSISFPRYCTGVLKSQEYAKDVGATTIALTDTQSSPLAKNADFLLIAKSDIISLVGSLAAPMSVINALIAAAASRKHEEMTNVLDKLEDVWDAYHVYEKYDE